MTRYGTRTKDLFLWCIGGTLMLMLLFSPAHYAATRESADPAEKGLLASTIPALMPDDLLAFDPVNYLMHVQMNESRMHRATVAMAQLEYGVDLRRIEAAAHDVKAHGKTLFYPIIFEAAYRYGVDPAIVKAIIQAESNYNPKAVSHKGAQGLMQLMPVTAREMGVKNVFSPQQNIHGGTAYFKKLLIRFNGNVKLALAAYNAGSHRVKQYKGIPPYEATRTYIEKVLQYHRTYSQYSRRSETLPSNSS